MNHVDKSKEIDLLEYWRIILKRKWVIVTFAGSLIFLVGVMSFLATPQYESTAILWIEEGTTNILSLEEVLGYQSPVFRDTSFFNTQLELLQSRALTERVVKRMDLLSRPEFQSGKKRSFISYMKSSVKNIITFKWLTSKKKSKDDKSKSLFPDDPYSDAAKMILGGLKIRSVRDTKLVEVSYTSPYPVLSAEIVNTLADEFKNFLFEKRYERTQLASDFLNTQIASLQEELTTKTQQLQKYIKDKDLLSLSSLSDSENAALDTLTEYNQAYTQARILRFQKEAAYRELKDIDVDSIPQSISDPIVQQLKGEYSRIKNTYDEKSKDFKPDHPEMIRLKARSDSMKEELKKVVDTAEAEYNAAIKRESSLKSLLDRQKEAVAKMSSDAILFNSLRIEVENKRRQLDSLVEKRDQTSISEQLGGLKSSNISLIDQGEVPDNPVSPKKRLNLILAFFLGIFGGTGLCFILEYFDNSLNGPEDVEKLANLPSLGVVPHLERDGVGKNKSKRYFGYRYSYGNDYPQDEESSEEIKGIELINHLFPRFSISEDYRTIRTSILLSHAEDHPKSISFSSSLPMEGKSATVVNMAIAFSQLDERVLVIDADLRKPKLHQIFKARNVAGLSNCLTGKKELNEAIQKTSIQNIWILPSGPIPPNPTELLNSRRMKELLEEIRKAFDYILIDTPPVLAVTDGVIVSSLSDSTVLVINGSKLTRKAFLKAVGELRKARSKIIGVVFNGIKLRKGNHFYMDYYHYYRSDYFDDDGQQKKIKE